MGAATSNTGTEAGCELALTADQFLERGLFANRIEVRVVRSKRAEPLHPIDCEPKVLDRVGGPPRKALAAGEVVKWHSVLRIGFDQLADPQPRRTRRTRRAPGAAS